MQSTENTPLNKSTLHPVLNKLFQKRGYSQEFVDELFSWNLNDLPNFDTLIDLEKAALRIIKAIENNEVIAIYGDYDVDGTTSCALLFRFFQMLGLEPLLIQPSRFVEGYGLHVSSIEQAYADKVNVLITVDCGITSNQAALVAKEKGIDLIITDHHKQVGEQLLKAYAVINPNRNDEPIDSTLRTLAGVGVAFCLALKIKKIIENKGTKLPSLYCLLPYVAIGTISDLAPLSPMNLKLVRHGLKAISQTPFIGLKVFFTQEELQANLILSEKIAYFIGPMINSKGRLDHPEKALKLLITDDPNEAKENFLHLELANRERRMIQAEVFDQAKSQVIKNISSQPNAQILYQPDWHEGVIGIVASKIVETFGTPALIFTNASEEGVIKASARTAGELNIFDALASCQDLFLKFGGHKAAAGLSMKKENLNVFIQRFNTYLESIPLILRTKIESFDLDISLEEIDSQLVRDLELLEPFGMCHERPIFRVKDALIQSYRIMKDTHVRWYLTSPKKLSRQLQGVSFNYLTKWNEPHPDQLYEAQNINGLTVQFTLGINRFQGNESIQLMVQKIYPGQLN